MKGEKNMGFKRIIRFQNDFEQGQEKQVNSTLETSASSNNDTLKVKQLERIWLPESPLECRIDPRSFEGEWIEHQPTTKRQEETMMIYQDAKDKGRLHPFTCMTIDPSVKDGKLVYQKGMPIRTIFSYRQWEKMIINYNLSRNSRMMTRTEYVCRNLFIIQKMVEESGYKIEVAWRKLCDASEEIGHYCDSDNFRECFEPTGSRNVCGFYDLGNAYKLIKEDPWKETRVFLAAGGDCLARGWESPVADIGYLGDVDYVAKYGVGMLAMD